MTKLQALCKEIKDNKTEGNGPCEKCPLQNGEQYVGPIEFPRKGNDSPKIMIITESPSRLAKDVNINEEDLKTGQIGLKIIADYKDNEKTWSNKLPKFLSKLTGKGIVDNLRIASNFYWTHTIKCYTQPKGKGIGVREANYNLGKDFKTSSKQCSCYLKEEIKCIISKLELIVVVGEKAYEGVQKALNQRAMGNFTEKSIIREMLPNKLIVLYHPSNYKRRQKNEKIEAYYQRVSATEKKYEFVKGEMSKMQKRYGKRHLKY